MANVSIHTELIKNTFDCITQALFLLLSLYLPLSRFLPLQYASSHRPVNHSPASSLHCIASARPRISISDRLSIPPPLSLSILLRRDVSAVSDLC